MAETGSKNVVLTAFFRPLEQLAIKRKMPIADLKRRVQL